MLTLTESLKRENVHLLQEANVASRDYTEIGLWNEYKKWNVIGPPSSEMWGHIQFKNFINLKHLNVELLNVVLETRLQSCRNTQSPSGRMTSHPLIHTLTEQKPTAISDIFPEKPRSRQQLAAEEKVSSHERIRNHMQIMDETVIPKIPAKLITRSKAKSSTGYRQIVNFLDNLSRDETGAPVKWKFNQMGVKLARGIGKKIADAGKQGTALKYDARTSLVKAVLHKKYSSTKLPSAGTATQLKQSNSEDSNNVVSDTQVSNGDSTTLLDDGKRKEGGHRDGNRSKKSGPQGPKTKLPNGNNQHSKSAISVKLETVDSKSIPVPRKRGRPKKILIEQDSDCLRDKGEDNVLDTDTVESINKVQSWTNLNQKVFKRTFIGKLMKKNLEGLSCEDSADSDRVDSEVETESVGSSVSSASVRQRKKMKTVNRTGIMLGPKKLLRSQDSMMTRKTRGMKVSVVKAQRKPRKRTLSGEFELLDENLLRKKRRQDDDQQSDVESDFSEGISKGTSKVDDSDVDSTISDMKFISETMKKQADTKSIFTESKDNHNVKDNVSAPNECVASKDVLTATYQDNDMAPKPKKRGRPAKVKQAPLSGGKSKTGISVNALPKVFGPKCVQERARKLLLKRSKSSSPSRLQIIGPGGLIFMKCTEPVKETDFQADLAGSEGFLKSDQCEEVIQSTVKADVQEMDMKCDILSETKYHCVIDSVQALSDTKENISSEVEPAHSDVVDKVELYDTAIEVVTKPDSVFTSENAVINIGTDQNLTSSWISDSSAAQPSKGAFDHGLLKENGEIKRARKEEIEDGLLQESSATESPLPGRDVPDPELTASNVSPDEHSETSNELENSVHDETIVVSVTLINSPTSDNSSHGDLEQLFTSGTDNTDKQTDTETNTGDISLVDNMQEESLNANDNEIDRTDNLIPEESVIAHTDTEKNVDQMESSISLHQTDSHVEPDVTHSASEDIQAYGVNSASLKHEESKTINDRCESQNSVVDTISGNATAVGSTTDNTNANKDLVFSGHLVKENLDVSGEKNEVVLYDSVKERRMDIHIKGKEVTASISGKSSPVPDDDPKHENTDSEKKLGVKREFQLRQKASRSPLEIIAMRQSQEERQYILEQTRKAIKREEKQKKMRERIKKLEQENMIKIKEDEKCIAEEVRKVEEDVETGRSEEIREIIEKKDEKLEEKSEEKKTVITSANDCKTCSVVLIDFVKYLKSTNSSYSVESGSVMEEWETIEDTETFVSEESTENMLTDDMQDIENEVPQKCEEIEPKCDAKDEVVLADEEDNKIIKNDESKPLKKKRKPSARKQARSVTYSAQLTAEIVSNPFFTGDETQTVPPLRLKIKQNIIAKPKPRSKKGLKFTVKKRHSARKGMPPVPVLPKRGILPELNVDSGVNAKTPHVVDSGIGSFEKSYIEFYKEQKSKPLKKSRHNSKTDKKFSFETITEEENALSKQSVQEEAVTSEPATSELPTSEPATSESATSESVTYQCRKNACGFVSTTKRVMESHVYVHLKNIPFRCVHCNQVFPSRGLTFLHMRSMHPTLDARMEAAEKVDEHLHFTEIKQTVSNSLRSPPKNSVNAATTSTSPDAVILSVVTPASGAVSTGCYCCSHCDFSAPQQQDILDHINSAHSSDIQYTCNMCNMAIVGSKEGIAKHFAEIHPNQPIMYKCLPDFYDVNKNSPNGEGADKGNIFDRMNDLFTTNEPGDEGGPPFQKTSAEADSTTAEIDDSSQKADMVDGIEELAKSYEARMRQTAAAQNSGIAGIPVYATMQSLPGNASLPVVGTGHTFVYPQEPVRESEDMGLKIVDVVSLSEQPNTWNQQHEQVPDKSKNIKIVENTAVNGNTVNEVGQVAVTNNLTPKDPQHPQLQLDQRQKQQRFYQTPKQQPEGKPTEKQELLGTTYKCEKCNVHAPVLSAMVEHLRVTHKDIQRLFLCPYCRQYEGSNEPEIHRHIKQYHHSPDQKSPPVALSIAAKKHLRTIQVPVDADAKKVGEKFVVEKDIYKCLKCQKHMPSLNFIYDHLEKAHHEVFVYVCPYCKNFRAKTEDRVFHHIKNEHKDCTEDIMLSLAIEENLFTRVQSLVKEKSSGRSSYSQKSQSPQVVKPALATSKTSKDPEDEVIVVGESRKQAPIAPSKPLQPNMPTAPARMRVPLQFAHPAPPAHFQQSKSSLRKSTPHHIPPQTQQSGKEAFEHQNYQQFNIPPNRTGLPSPRVFQPSAAPPPLMRAPPPLLRFPCDGNPAHSQPIKQPISSFATPSSASRTNDPPSYSTATQRVMVQDNQHMQARAVSPHSRHGSSGSPSQMVNTRPVLRVPSVPTHNPQQRPAGNIGISPYQDYNRIPGPITPVSRKVDGSAPLDLSKSQAPPSQPKDANEDGDDMPPDAFQIFNLRPAAAHPPIIQQQMSSMPIQNMAAMAYQARFRQQMQYQQQMNRMPSHMQRGARQYRPMMTRPPPYTRAPRHISQILKSVQRPYMPTTVVSSPVANVLPPKEASPVPVQSESPKDNRDMIGLGQMRVFKCPYCPDVVPLGMGEVAPHIEKVHPGHSIVFRKIDNCALVS